MWNASFRRATSAWACSACASGWKWSADISISGLHRAKARPLKRRSRPTGTPLPDFMKPTPITVLLADDHLIVREGFRSLLRLDPTIVIIGEAHDGREAVA